MLSFLKSFIDLFTTKGSKEVNTCLLKRINERQYWLPHILLGKPCIRSFSQKEKVFIWGFHIFIGKEKTNKQLHSLKSFSLIELLLVVVILGVIAGLAIPNFSQTYASLQLQETAKNIAYVMRYAQSQAVIKQKNLRLEFDEPNKTYWLTQSMDEAQEKNTKGGEASFERILGRNGRTFNIPDELTLEIPKPFVEFYPNGDIEKMRIFLSNPKRKYFTVSTQEQTGYVLIFDFKVEE